MQRVGSSRHAALVIVALVALVGSAVVSAQANAIVKAQVRGFDGTTITVGSMGYKANFAKGDVGPKARIKRFNDDNEIKGIKLKYTGFEDDGNDPSSALSVARQLVTQDGVFALVGDASSYNPSAYFKQSHVPFFGWGFDTAYCSPKVPTTAGWGFGYNGCQVNTQPARVVDYAGKVYQYVSQQLHKQHPTVALINDDGETFRATMSQNVTSYKGSGFDVVFAKSIIPAPPAVVSDYSPYTAKLLTSNNGGQPDVITCLSGLQCLQLFTLLQAQGFTGIFQHALYTDIFVKAMAGTVVTASNANFNATDIPSLDQMRTDIAAVDPDQAKKLDAIVLAGYASTDMFIQVLKQIVKDGGTKAITPEAVQKAASKVLWEMKGFTGPISYPIASNYQGGPTTGYCTGLFKSDGTQWNTVVDYSCSKKTYPVKNS